MNNPGPLSVTKVRSGWGDEHGREQPGSAAVLIFKKLSSRDIAGQSGASNSPYLSGPRDQGRGRVGPDVMGNGLQLVDEPRERVTAQPQQPSAPPNDRSPPQPHWSKPRRSPEGSHC